jgi:AcrR family transcriptional regulator
MRKPPSSKNLARRSPLTRERVLQAALALADKNGLGSVTMRHLAQELGVEAMSLYKYVSNKDDLLDGLIELVALQMSVPSSNAGWKEALRERANSERKILNQHSWAVDLFESRSGTGVTRLRHQNHMIGILRKAKFPIDLVFKALIAQTSYVYGFVMMETAWSYQSKETTDQKRALISETEYPYVFEMIRWVTEKNKKNAEVGIHTPSGHSADFEFGLNLILNGLESASDIQTS